MPRNQKFANPFYGLLLVTGIVFAITATTYGVMAFRGARPPAISETGVPVRAGNLVGRRTRLDANGNPDTSRGRLDADAHPSSSPWISESSRNATSGVMSTGPSVGTIRRRGASIHSVR